MASQMSIRQSQVLNRRSNKRWINGLTKVESKVVLTSNRQLQMSNRRLHWLFFKKGINIFRCSFSATVMFAMFLSLSLEWNKKRRIDNCTDVESRIAQVSIKCLPQASNRRLHKRLDKRQIDDCISVKLTIVKHWIDGYSRQINGYIYYCKKSIKTFRCPFSATVGMWYLMHDLKWNQLLPPTQFKCIFLIILFANFYNFSEWIYLTAWSLLHINYYFSKEDLENIRNNRKILRKFSNWVLVGNMKQRIFKAYSQTSWTSKMELKPVSYFREKIYLRCSNVFWIHFLV